MESGPGQDGNGDHILNDVDRRAESRTLEAVGAAELVQRMHVGRDVGCALSRCVLWRKL
jgi:hypothetical protein